MKGEVTMKKYNNQRGNVLFLILIAVALFAALSYAVTQSSRSGGDSGRETNILNSAQLAQYPNSIRTAVLRQVIDGTAVTSVLFNAPASFGGTNRIEVFHPEGGGAVFQNAPSDFMNPAGSNPNGNWFYNLEFEVTNIGISTPSNLAGNELIAFLPGLTEAVCQRINVEAGIRPNISDAPPVTADINGGASGDYDINMVTGYTPPSTEVNLDSATGDLLDGQPFGCFDNAGEEFVYYHVLNER